MPGTIRTFSMPSKMNGAQRTSRSWTALKSAQRGIDGSTRFAAKAAP